MATYPKLLKPARMFPNMNGMHGISSRIKFDAPNPSLGQSTLVVNVAKHIGTIPAGAVICAAYKANPAAVVGTITVGSEALPAGILASADVIAIGNGALPLGALCNAPLAVDTPIFILSTAAVPASGQINFVIAYYLHRD